MKLLLVTPRSTDKKPPIGLKIPQLALHILAALTPSDIDLTVIDEQMDEIDFEKHYDLAGISIMTANAPRGYRIAQKLKEKGTRVVFGGIHASVLPDEALKFGDAVVIGEAEGIWPKVIEDFKNRELKKIYRSEPFDLNHSPLPRRDLKLEPVILGYKWPGFFTTRGCPFSCEFCSVSDVFGRKVRHLPVAHVIRDIENADSKIFLNLDDNVVGNPGYARKLFEALAPLKIEWGGQSTIGIAKDEELLKLCYRAGCRGLFIGIESISTQGAARFQKTLKTFRENLDAVKKIQDAGILFHPSFVFGLDEDTVDIFEKTLDFLYKARITTATFNILTPYPGTRLYHRLKKEGRLITEDWEKYNHSTVVFRPKKMTVEELIKGYHFLKKEFYSLSNICKRIIRLSEISNPGLVQFFYAVFNNIAGRQITLESVPNNYKTFA
ncbi:MAG: B12-binding domain-containing radical SAM protein [candidate division WOR-3 bacterium]|nr:B12-binding domain-containing radical SAM protein [candidate division WOR-3 bacterium]